MDTTNILVASRPGSRISAFASRALPVPAGAERLGSIDHPSGIGGGELLKLRSGIYVVREVDTIRSIEQRHVRELLATVCADVDLGTADDIARAIEAER